MSRRRRKTREIEGSNLSFLDVVSCGFGAIILLLVIIKIAEPNIIENLAIDLSRLVSNLTQQQRDIKRDRLTITRQLGEKQQRLIARQQVLAALQRDALSIRGQFKTVKNEFDAQEIIQGRLQSAKQTLTEEMRRLLGRKYRRTDSTIGGVPVDSEYIIFIIDTSGSMHQNAWPLVLKKIQQVLAIYPRVKGIQVMNDMGGYMFSQYSNRWIPDTPARRKAIITRLATWRPFSNSSPVEGIEAAIRRFYAEDKQISLYVFGDDFAQGSIERVIETVNSLNRADRSGNRRVRIHAIGFPVLFKRGGIPTNAVRFAALMRKLAEDNNGSFVGLNSIQR